MGLYTTFDHFKVLQLRDDKIHPATKLEPHNKWILVSDATTNMLRILIFQRELSVISMLHCPL